MNDWRESWVWVVSLFLGGSNDHHSIHPLSLLRSAAVKERMSSVSTKSSNMPWQNRKILSKKSHLNRD